MVEAPLNSGRGEVSPLLVAMFAAAFVAMLSFVFLLSDFPLFLFYLCPSALSLLILEFAVFVLLRRKR
jgi:hypothetical protein